MDDNAVNAFERAAIELALADERFSAWRVALLRQVDAAKVVSRSEKVVGYYVDFNVPADLRVVDPPSAWLKSPPEASVVHPDGKNAIFFILYVKDGLIEFLEASSTGDWPKDESLILPSVAQRS